KDIGGKLADALHRRGAAGDHHTAVETLRKSGALDFREYQIEYLVHPLMDDVRENFARQLAIALGDCAWQLNYVAGIHERLVRAPVSLLQSLGVRLGDAESLHD